MAGWLQGWKDGGVKGIIKSGNVKVWAIGDTYAIEIDTSKATDQEFRDAVVAEELLDTYRMVAQWN